MSPSVTRERQLAIIPPNTAEVMISASEQTEFIGPPPRYEQAIAETSGNVLQDSRNSNPVKVSNSTLCHNEDNILTHSNATPNRRRIPAGTLGPRSPGSSTTTTSSNLARNSALNSSSSSGSTNDSSHLQTGLGSRVKRGLESFIFFIINMLD